MTGQSELRTPTTECIGRMLAIDWDYAVGEARLHLEALLPEATA